MAEASAVASRFGQRLAHTEKKYRDQALKKLTKYLAHKREWTALDWDKLWKALFYCMWMSDKRPVQLELAQNLAALVHVLPSRTLALEFVHSFFRTMHREWHGLDGLRLDKFYDLVRQFVRQTLALLAKHKFARAAVSEFVSILSTEVVSQRPNGLRMHLADLYLAEISNAVGDSVPTGAFLLLLEPFFTLLSSEYDKSVFQRVRELVFLPMLSEYKFGKQEEKGEDGETDEDSGDDTTKVFPNVDLARVQHRIFAIAAAEDTAERNRSALYSLYGKFAAVTEVDSLKASQEEPAVQDDDMPDADEDEAKEQPTEAAADSEQKKKKKNKKKRKQADAEATPVQEESEKPKEEEAPPAKKQKKSKKDKETVEEQPKVVTPEKKQKKSKKELKEVAKEVKETPKESPKKVQQDEEVAEKPKKKKAKKQEQEVEVAKEEKKAKVAEETKKEKKAKGEKKETKSTDEPKKAKTAEEGKKEKKAEEPKEEKKANPAMIIKSGVKFQRCAGCGGFGKKLLRPGKDVCGHCERTRKTQKKVAAKKRKAESDAKVEAEESNTPAKKVTFGKNKALPHSLSVKRLKASAKKDAVPKDADIKGVLKASVTTPDVKSSTKGSKGKSSDGKKRRAKASDFF